MVEEAVNIFAKFKDPAMVLLGIALIMLGSALAGMLKLFSGLQKCYDKLVKSNTRAVELLRTVVFGAAKAAELREEERGEDGE
jgi:hypothetical protein